MIVEDVEVIFKPGEYMRPWCRTVLVIGHCGRARLRTGETQLCEVAAALHAQHAQDQEGVTEVVTGKARVESRCMVHAG